MKKSESLSRRFRNIRKNSKLKFVKLLKLKSLYSLSDEQFSELRNAAAESGKTIELNLRNANASNRQLAVSFARQFDSLDEETAQKLFEILKKHKGD